MTELMLWHWNVKEPINYIRLVRNDHEGIDGGVYMDGTLLAVILSGVSGRRLNSGMLFLLTITGNVITFKHITHKFPGKVDYILGDGLVREYGKNV